jgi:hypothetical protein
MSAWGNLGVSNMPAARRNAPAAYVVDRGEFFQAALLLSAPLRQPITCLRVLQSGQMPMRVVKRSVSIALFIATRLAISSRSTRQLSQ